MARFRFRAQAALDVRVKEDEAAQRDLARTEGERLLAVERAAAARRAAAEGRQAAGGVVGVRQGTMDQEWYRFWILGLERQCALADAHVEACEAEVRRATAACQRARQRRRSLERFREKSLAAHDAAEAAEERKLIDELATRRHTAAGGPHGPDMRSGRNQGVLS